MQAMDISAMISKRAFFERQDGGTIQKGADVMRRKIIEESRTLSSLSLEMDASGRMKPMVKLICKRRTKMP